MNNEIDQIAKYCRTILHLDEDTLDAEGYYNNLPLSVIDTIFSIGARYESTELTVKRFCTHFRLKRLSDVRYPEPSSQLSISEFLNYYDRFGIERMADEVFQNRQRTSTRNGILKADAVYRVSKLLCDHQVDYLQDVQKILGDPVFEAAFQSIPGQTSGISLRYFYMLVGTEDFIKPDRMIARFLEAATHRTMTTAEMQTAILGVVKLLSANYPNLTPRRLDHMIWSFQRQARIDYDTL
jgi:hypothetical protein